jgi:hypothetical protein
LHLDELFGYVARTRNHPSFGGGSTDTRVPENCELGVTADVTAGVPPLEADSLADVHAPVNARTSHRAKMRRSNTLPPCRRRDVVTTGWTPPV